MKKLLALCFALVLALSLAACGSDGTPSGGTATPPANNSTTTPPASSGGNNTTSAPPSSTPDEPSAVTYEWPENDYTAGVPKTPDTIELGESYEMKSQGNFNIQFAESVDNDTLKAYADELKDAGFADSIGDGEDANGHYWFSAYNDAGYQVEVRHQSMSIVKPQ